MVNSQPEEELRKEREPLYWRSMLSGKVTRILDENFSVVYAWIGSKYDEMKAPIAKAFNQKISNDLLAQSMAFGVTGGIVCTFPLPL